MRKTLFYMLFLPAAYFFMGPIKADHLDGLWHNKREDITIRIESQEDGFRAKRIDQGVWYYYQQAGNNIYEDRRGNRYEIIHENEMMWRDARTNSRINFRRVENHERYRDEKDYYDKPDSRWNRNNASRQEHFEGIWLNRKTGQRLEIRDAGNGYQVRGSEDNWEKYVLRKESLLRSRHGEIIELINPNMIRWSQNRNGKEQIYTRVNFQKSKNKERGKAKHQRRCCH